MDRWLASHKAAVCLGDALSIVYTARTLWDETHRSELRTEFENLTEDLVKLHRQILELPPQSSTALATEQDELPF
jgi:hypothetical protein